MLATTLPRRRTPLDPETLANVATALVSAGQIWQGTARFDPATRQPVRLVADEAFEAWIIGWTTGQGLELHDHGDSAGAIVVAAGRLHETTLGERGLEVRTLDRGLVRRLRPRTVHGVNNIDDRPATSIHVYSPPLARMTHFDSTGRVAVKTVDLAPEVPLLPTAVGQLLRIACRI
jgi:predicted metal-dependent enzyme (double-stranded beta helix superfamily)